MASERFWQELPAANFISDGGTEGQVQVLSTRGMKVKMKVILKSTSPVSSKPLEIKKIIDMQNLIVGPRSAQMRGKDSTTDISAFTVASGATLTIESYERPAIFPNEIVRSVYEEEPVVAIRTIGVGPLGQVIDETWDGIVPQEFDDVQITRDDEGDVVEAKFFLRTALIADIVLEYDLNKDVIRATDTLRVADVG